MSVDPSGVGTVAAGAVVTATSQEGNHPTASLSAHPAPSTPWPGAPKGLIDPAYSRAAALIAGSPFEARMKEGFAPLPESWIERGPLGTGAFGRVDAFEVEDSEDDVDSGSSRSSSSSSDRPKLRRRQKYAVKQVFSTAAHSGATGKTDADRLQSALNSPEAAEGLHNTIVREVCLLQMMTLDSDTEQRLREPQDRVLRLVDWRLSPSGSVRLVFPLVDSGDLYGLIQRRLKPSTSSPPPPAPAVPRSKESLYCLDTTSSSDGSGDGSGGRKRWNNGPSRRAQSMRGGVWDSLPFATTHPDFLIPSQAAKCITKQLLEALVYLHRDCRMMHRDIKASNVLLSSDGSIFLADFGWARRAPPTQQRREQPTESSANSSSDDSSAIHEVKCSWLSPNSSLNDASRNRGNRASQGEDEPGTLAGPADADAMMMLTANPCAMQQRPWELLVAGLRDAALPKDAKQHHHRPLRYTAASVDIYGLGCTVVMMLLGRTIFHGSSPNEVLAAIFERLGTPHNQLVQRLLGDAGIDAVRRSLGRGEPWQSASVLPLDHDACRDEVRRRLRRYIHSRATAMAQSSSVPMPSDRFMDECNTAADFLARCFHPDPECRDTAEALLRHRWLRDSDPNFLGRMRQVAVGVPIARDNRKRLREDE